MKTILSFLLITFSLQISTFGNEKQVVYNLITKEGSTLDRIVHETYTDYTVKDVDETSGYKLPKVVRAEMPSIAVDASGKEISGYVLILYLIKDDGNVETPVVLKSTNPILSQVAIDAAKDWKFEASKYNNESVWSTAAQEFHFRDKN